MILSRAPASSPWPSGHSTGPGRNAVHADLGTELLRERAREHVQAGLGGAVHRVVAQRAQRVDVDDVEDEAARICCSAGAAACDRNSGTLRLRAQQVVPRGRRDLADLRGVESRGIVHQHVERAEVRDRELHQQRQLRDVEQVRLDGRRPSSARAGIQLARPAPRRRAPTCGSGSRDSRRRACRRARDGGAHAARGARDQHRLAR